MSPIPTSVNPRFEVTLRQLLMEVQKHPDRTEAIGLAWFGPHSNDFLCNPTLLAVFLDVSPSDVRKNLPSHGFKDNPRLGVRIPDHLTPQAPWMAMCHPALKCDCTEDDAVKMRYDPSHRARVTPIAPIWRSGQAQPRRSVQVPPAPRPLHSRSLNSSLYSSTGGSPGRWRPVVVRPLNSLTRNRSPCRCPRGISMKWKDIRGHRPTMARLNRRILEWFCHINVTKYPG
jgi:hypothetical protein